MMTVRHLRVILWVFVGVQGSVGRGEGGGVRLTGGGGCDLLNRGHAGAAVETRQGASEVAGTFAGRVDSRVGHDSAAFGGVLADAVVESQVRADDFVGRAEKETGGEGIVGATHGARATGSIGDDVSPVYGGSGGTGGRGTELHQGTGSGPRAKVDLQKLLLGFVVLADLLGCGNRAVVLLHVFQRVFNARLRAADDGGRSTDGGCGLGGALPRRF